MSAEANKVLVKRWFKEVWNEGRVETIDELLAKDARGFGLSDDPAKQMKGPVDFKPFHKQFRDAFPDIKVEVLDLVAEGDRVAARCQVTGTHIGCTLGCDATHKPVEFHGMVIVRIKNGQIIEGWNQFDFMGMYKTIGVLK